ncbi:MAG TPA: DNA-processing protein DprA [Caldimonas sp.]|jgi:DNA processing protein|nr:DNA-processing protein DprA [Caldimonas sp.]HEX2542178.1 DNA-processing protein DprA [Caldimonas sp.]
MDRDELSAWLRLLETPGIGRDSARALLTAFGSPQSILDASTDARRSVVGAVAAAALASEPPAFAVRLDAAWNWLQAADDPAETRGVLAIGDPRFPSALLEIADPPLLLYVRGRIDMLARPALAIVGSRNPTAQGLENARAFASHLSHAGWAVVSGLALGVDGAAHEGALEGDGGTIAVVGTGLDRVYPARHRALAKRIATRGLLVSEFAVGTPALPPHFPVRNRIIAGLTRGTLVVEAALHSGSLITAKMAAEAGREVFAIPGSIHSPQSRGCHFLLKQGAKLVETASDILEELAPASAGSAARAVAAGPPPAQDPVLEALGYEPMSLDELIARTGRSAAELSARLLDLELEGRVARSPGQTFQRIERG